MAWSESPYEGKIVKVAPLPSADNIRSLLAQHPTQAAAFMSYLGFLPPDYTRTSLKGITGLRLSLAQRDTGFPLETALPILYPNLLREDILALTENAHVNPTDGEVGKHMAEQASSVLDTLNGRTRI